MPDVIVTPVSLKCKICGGDIVNNYLAGTSVCANCGNRWSISDLIPDYGKYSRIIADINKADDIIQTGTKAASANEAKLLYKTAVIECGKFNDHVSSDLIRLCENGQKEADLLATYIKGMNFFEKKAYDSAKHELVKIPGYRDADETVEKCKAEIEAERKRQIPWAVIFSLILPAIAGLFLKEKLGWPWAVCSILFFAGSAGLGYVLYRGGIPSIIIKIVSFLCAAPLIIYAVLAYVFHVPTVTAVTIAIGVPTALFIVIAVLSEKKEK